MDKLPSPSSHRRKFRFRYRLKPSGLGVVFLALIAITSSLVVYISNPIVELSFSAALSFVLVDIMFGFFVLSRIRGEWKRKSVHAQREVFDEVEIVNSSIFPLTNLNVAELAQGRRHADHLMTFVPSRSLIKEKVHRRFEKRGQLKWQAIEMQTDFPFGIFRKVKVLPNHGSRIVWPEIVQGFKPLPNEFRRYLIGAGDIVEGELRDYLPGDDYRDIVWTRTYEFEKPRLRVRSLPETVFELSLSLETSNTEAFEEKIRRLASVVSTFDAKDNVKLVVRSSQYIDVVRGKYSVLDQLAVVQPELRLVDSTPQRETWK